MGRSWWGWGRTENALTDAECADLARRVAPFLALDGALAPVPGVPELPGSRLPAPPCAYREDPQDRLAHARGKAYRDVVRNLAGLVDNPPDVVAYPGSEAAVVAVLDWAGARGTPVVPYGGGTSVVGGVEYRGDDPWLSLDLSGVDGVLAVDGISRSAHVRAGTSGPALSAALRTHDLTLRHYPQSFEFSTVGGWLATRAGGHFATGATHIDDAVEALRVVTPVGVAESLRVPASGAGPSPDRLWLGSEGALGVIVSAWLRVLPQPTHRARTAVRFDDFDQGVQAVRVIVQAGLRPSNCRLLDPLEAMLNTDAPDGGARLLLGFESADEPVDGLLARALAVSGGTTSTVDTTVGWRDSFLKAPYRRDALARLGVVVETFETACPWSRFDDLHAAVLASLADAGAIATCRFTHAYPDGPAPYYTVYAAAPRGHAVARWDDLKVKASDAITRHGGTITHHHAVGRDHVPWYARQQPEPHRRALEATKRALDPQGVLNPGVLGLPSYHGRSQNINI